MDGKKDLRRLCGSCEVPGSLSKLQSHTPSSRRLACLTSQHSTSTRTPTCCYTTWTTSTCPAAGRTSRPLQQDFVDECSGSRYIFDDLSSSMWPPVSSYAAPLPQRLHYSTRVYCASKTDENFRCHVSVLMRLISSPGSNSITSSQQLTSSTPSLLPSQHQAR